MQKVLNDFRGQGNPPKDQDEAGKGPAALRGQTWITVITEVKPVGVANSAVQHKGQKDVSEPRWWVCPDVGGMGMVRDKT